MILIVNMPVLLRKLVVLVMCAGILLPVLSSADDIALLSPVLQGLAQSSDSNQFDKPAAGAGTQDAAFWVLFDFLQCPVLFHFDPGMDFAGTVFASDQEFPSSSAPRPAGRSPPSYI